MGGSKIIASSRTEVGRAWHFGRNGCTPVTTQTFGSLMFSGPSDIDSGVSQCFLETFAAGDNGCTSPHDSIGPITDSTGPPGCSAPTDLETGLSRQSVNVVFELLLGRIGFVSSTIAINPLWTLIKPWYGFSPYGFPIL